MEQRVVDFLNFLTVEKGYSEHTIAAYQNDLTQLVRYLEEQAENIDWATVDKDALVSYILFLKEREYASATVARKVAAIKSFFHFLVADGFLKDDPTATLDSPRAKKPLPRVLSAEDINRLLEEPAKGSTPKALRDTALLELLYATGMISAHPRDILVIRVSKAKNYAEGTC